ncbi:unnamed protein product [Prunus armeniaca]
MKDEMHQLENPHQQRSSLRPNSGQKFVAIVAEKRSSANPVDCSSNRGEKRSQSSTPKSNFDFSEGASTQGGDRPPKFLWARKVLQNLLPPDPHIRLVNHSSKAISENLTLEVTPLHLITSQNTQVSKDLYFSFQVVTMDPHIVPVDKATVISNMPG